MRLAARIIGVVGLAWLASCQRAVVTPSPHCESVRGVFAAASADGSSVTPEAMTETVAVIEQRLARAGFVGGAVHAEGIDSVLIELRTPAPADAFNVLIRPAIDVAFIPVAPGTLVEVGDLTPVNAQPILTGADVASATETTDRTGNPAVIITLKNSGRATLADWTGAHVGEQLAITLHRVVLVAPTIQGPIDGGQMEIQGALTEPQLRELVTAADQGVLPLLLTQTSVETVTSENCPPT